MNNILSIYANILEEYLYDIFKNDINIDPIKLNFERFNARVAFISSILFLSNNQNCSNTEILENTNNWLKSKFSQENFFSTILNNLNKTLVTLINADINKIEKFENIEIATLYENLLGIESGKTDIKNTKNYRNKLGSYYTPSTLAKVITNKTINEFFNKNIENSSNMEKIISEIPSINYVDFSCGGGNFLLEVINYYENLFKEINLDQNKQQKLLEEIALNIYAFDVDCIALEIAKLNLLIKINQHNLYDKISNNFTHSNFLLHTTNNLNNKTKLETFIKGYIYHNNLSTHSKNLNKFDIILGNPPWEKIRFEEKQFYSMYVSEIKNKHFKLARNKEINKIKSNNTQLANFGSSYKEEINDAKIQIKKNKFFDLSNNGELNTYMLFTNAAINLVSERGVIGLILKSGILTSQINKKLFQYLVENNLIISIFDFINRKKIFDIDSRERFCFLLLGQTTKDSFNVAMNLMDINEINTIKGISLSKKQLESLNPLTKMLPNFSSKEEIELLLKISYTFPIFNKVYHNTKFGRIVHFTSHSDYISKTKTDNNIAIYEGKFINQFDGKYSGFNNIESKLKYGSKSKSVLLDDDKKHEKNYFPESRFFIEKEKWNKLSKNYTANYMLAWRSLTSASNTRTAIATVLPFIPASQSIQFLVTDNNKLLYLTGLFNSIIFDFILKKKLSGIDLTQSLINQVPVPDEKALNNTLNLDGKEMSIINHINLLVYKLLKNDSRLDKLFSHYTFLKNEVSTNESRFEIIRKIDLIFIFLYNLTLSEINLVIKSFPKQYSENDINWFDNNIQLLYST